MIKRRLHGLHIQESTPRTRELGPSEETWTGCLGSHDTDILVGVTCLAGYGQHGNTYNMLPVHPERIVYGHTPHGAGGSLQNIPLLILPGQTTGREVSFE